MNEITEKSGIGRANVQRIVSEDKCKKTKKLPIVKNTRSLIDTISNTDRNIIRQKVHTFWNNCEFPTVQKIMKAIADDKSLPTLKQTLMYKLLKELQFVFSKRRKNCVLMDRKDLIYWRRNYLKNLQNYREERKTIYYLGETWFNIGEKLLTDTSNQVSKSKRLLTVHIGSNNGFVEGGLLIFEPNLDCCQEMHSDIFLKWFVSILPMLDENSVIIMDNAPHYTIEKEKLPTYLWKKKEIIQWFESKNIKVNSFLLKFELLQLIKSYKKPYQNCIVEEAARAQNKIVLRLPPYHSDLNPIELVWSMVKGYVMQSYHTSMKINDSRKLIINSIKRITRQNWLKFIQFTKAEEQVFWDIDNNIKCVMETVDPNIFSDTSSSSSDSDEDL